MLTSNTDNVLNSFTPTDEENTGNTNQWPLAVYTWQILCIQQFYLIIYLLLYVGLYQLFDWIGLCCIDHFSSLQGGMYIGLYPSEISWKIFCKMGWKIFLIESIHFSERYIFYIKIGMFVIVYVFCYREEVVCWLDVRGPCWQELWEWLQAASTAPQGRCKSWIEVWNQGFRCKIEGILDKQSNSTATMLFYIQEVSQVTWHGRGDYFASVMPRGDSMSVLIHQLSRRRSQVRREQSQKRDSTGCGETLSSESS